MPKIKPVGYGEFARKLMRAGYVPVRKSKHIVYFHLVKEITVPVPYKHGRDIPTGLLNKLLKELKLSKEEFNNL